MYLLPKNPRTWFVILALAGALVGCDDRRNRSAPGAREEAPRRVVSLSPAITQIIVDLDAADSLVAVGENDNAAPQGLPTVGKYPDYSSEAVLAAKPTHVLMMAGVHGVPAHLTKLADEHHFELISYPYPEQLADIANIICNWDDHGANPPPNPSVAFVLDRFSSGLVLREQYFLDRLVLIQELFDKVNDLNGHVKVLLVIATDPVQVIGEKTIHDQLITYLNAENVGAYVAEGPAPTLSKEMILTAAPEVILLLLPQERPLGALEEDPRLASFRGLDIPAVKNNRIVLIDDPLAQLPSTSLVRVAVAMGKAIHPEMAVALDKVLTEKASTLAPVQDQPTPAVPTDAAP